MRALQGRSIYLAYEDAPPNCSKKINEMLAELYVGGRDKSNRRLPTQFSGRLTLSVPTISL